MSKRFLLEPEIIAFNENILPELNNELVLAKNFLKQQTAATGDSLYDHLVDVVHKILSQRPPDVVESFEQYSWEIKKEKFKPNFDVLMDIIPNPQQMELAQKLAEMFKIVVKSQGLEDMGEEEQELDLEEEAIKPKITDLVDHNYYFRQAGFGLPECECYNIYIALKMLATKEPVSTIRFFGKIFGIKANYYIAETDLTIEELDRRIREFDLKDMPGEGEGESGEGELKLEHVEIEPGAEGEEMPPPKELVPPKLPPVPQSTWQAPPPIPVERPGQGVNKKVYWACNQPGDMWICLPDVTPQQIQVARATLHAVTGDLDAEVLTFPPFEGTERNYLRAQIGRIASATCVSPQGFFTFGSGEEEADFDIEEAGGDMAMNMNPFYQGHTLKDLLDQNLTYWVHHGRHILKQGRTLWWNPRAEMDEAVEEEEDEGPPPPEPETGPQLLTSLADDAKVEGVGAWSARTSSNLAPDRAIAMLRSNLWPGAAAYATTGKKSECMYIGWGLKYVTPNYTPPQLPRVQDEYFVGPEVMEMADPTFADEEAYRIAHLPPQPPQMLGEGEGMAAEELDDDEDEG